MRKSSSFFLLLANPTYKGSQLILNVLKSTRGRYKLFGIVQYTAALFKDCMLDYIKSYRIKEWTRSLRRAKNVQDSMSNGRKIFRLLRWIEEIGSIDKSLKRATDLLYFLKFLRHLIGIFYYTFDNIVWIANAGVINKYISDPAWRWDNAKNVLSLLRYFLLLAITMLKVRKILTLEIEQRRTVLAKNVVISEGSSGHKMILELFKIRYKRRNCLISLMKNFLRILMLSRATRMPGFERISIIFIDVAGIVSYALGVAKMIVMQKVTVRRSNRSKSVSIRGPLLK